MTCAYSSSPLAFAESATGKFYRPSEGFLTCSKTPPIHSSTALSPEELVEGEGVFLDDSEPPSESRKKFRNPLLRLAHLTLSSTNDVPSSGGAVLSLVSFSTSTKPRRVSESSVSTDT